MAVLVTVLKDFFHKALKIAAHATVITPCLLFPEGETFAVAEYHLSCPRSLLLYASRQ